MKAQIMRIKNGWYIHNLSGFDGIWDDTLSVSVELDVQELMRRDYKELGGLRFWNAIRKTVYEDAVPAVFDSKEEFRRRFRLESVNSLADLLARLQ